MNVKGIFLILWSLLLWVDRVTAQTSAQCFSVGVKSKTIEATPTHLDTPSPEGTWRALARFGQNGASKVILVNSETLKSTEMEMKNLADVVFGKDGHLLVSVNSSLGYQNFTSAQFDIDKWRRTGDVKEIDIKTGKVLNVHKSSFVLNGEVFRYNDKLGDDKFDVTGPDGKSFTYYDKWFSAMEDPNSNVPVKSYFYSPDNSTLFTSTVQNGMATVSFADRMGKPIGVTLPSVEGKYPSVKYSPNGDKAIVTISGSNKLHQFVVDLNKKKLISVEGYAESFSSDSKTLLETGNPASLRTLSNGHRTLLEGSKGFNGFVFSVDNKFVCAPGNRRTDTGEVTHQCWDTNTGKKNFQLTLPPATWIVGLHSDSKVEGFSQVTENGTIKFIYGIHNPHKTCEVKPVRVTCDCSKDFSDPLNKARILSAARIALCQEPFEEKSWRTITKFPVSENGLTEEEALSWLLRFSKPSGFDGEKHLPILLGILGSPITEKYPREVTEGLAGVAYFSDRLFNELMGKFPRLKDLGQPLSKFKPVCANAKEKDEMQEYFFDILNGKINRHREVTLDLFRPYAGIAKGYLDDVQRYGLADDAGDELAATAHHEAGLADVFPSKLYKFSYNAMLSLLGEDFHDLTDVVLARDKDSVRIFRMYVRDPQDGAVRSWAGFFYEDDKKLNVKDLPEKTIQEVKWSYQGKKYEARISLDKVALTREVIDTSKSFRYGDLWKDQVLRGVVVSGSNLGPGASARVLDQYRAYFLDKHFHFSEPEVIPDLPAYLKSKVAGNEPMDYFIKEAHSDGDEKNLFRLNKRAKISRGEKINADGTKEVIELIYPAPESAEEASNPKERSVLLSNREFGSWIKEREKKVGTQLIYLNGSCSSYSKAVFEISAAASPLFVNLASMSSMDTFANYADNIVYIALEGIRSRLDHESIRSKMREFNAEYREKRDNYLAFPDEAIYKEKIGDLVRIPLDVDIKIRQKRPDGTSVPYSIDSVE